MPESTSSNRRVFLQQVAALALVPTGLQRPLRAQQAAVVPSNAILSLEAALPGLLQKHGVPGLSFAVVENGVVARARGFGVKKAGGQDPVTADTIFEAASLSKPPFAKLTLTLAELGRIDLDASIGPFFRQPDFANDSTVDAITPRIVLSHRTGLSNWRPPREPMKLLFAPGSQFGYSGEAYVRLQRFIEKTMGESLTALAQQYVLTPSRMEHSSFVWRPEFARLAAEGHDSNGAVVRTRLWGFDPAAPPSMPLPPGAEGPPIFAVPNAAASLYTSATDYGRFLETMLAPPALDSMFVSNSRVSDEISWGLGWGLARVGGDDTFWQWGNNGVYRGFVVGSRHRRWGVVILTNSANGLNACRDVVAHLLGTDHPAFRWSLVIPRGM